MAMPTVVGTGVGNSGVGAVTYAYPAGYTAVADDIAVTLIQTETADTVTPPTNWGAITNVVVGSGATTKLWAIWRRLTTSEAAPSVADVGNHQVGRMIILRGCITTGNPWDVFATNTELVSDTSVSIPGVTTTVPNCMVLQAFHTGQDGSNTTAGATGWANALLAAVTERMDNWTASGLGGGLAMASGEKAAAGATGAMTATITAPIVANFKGLMTIAFKEQAAGPSVLAPLTMAPRVAV